MRNSFYSIALVCLAATASFPVSAGPHSRDAEAADGSVVPSVGDQPLDGRSFLLPKDSEISLVLQQDVSSKRNVKGDLVYFMTGENVLVDGKIAIPVGTSVVGQLTLSEKSGYFGDSGRLEISLLYIDMGSRTIRIHGSVGGRGAPKSGEVFAKGATILTIGLFKGKNAKIPGGTIVTGRILKDTIVDMAQ